MRKFLEVGGYLAGALLLAFGVIAIVMSVGARHEVRTSLAGEHIVGTPDSSIPGKLVNTGARAKAFAKIMRHHTLTATGGKTYSQMGQYLDSRGKQTSDKAKAAIDPTTHQPVANGARNIWVTETALTTALNMSYMAEQLALFGIVVGLALLLTGLGLVILTAFSKLHRSEYTIVARQESDTRTPTTV